MRVINLSTNMFTVLGLWPDGTSQALPVPAGMTVTIPGIQVAGSNYVDGFTAIYTAVNSDASGLVIHQEAVSWTFFQSGFYWALPCICVYLTVRSILYGLRLRAPGSGLD